MGNHISMFKVVVTGATGFIGKALCEYLLNKGIIVYGVGRNTKVLDELSLNSRFHAITLDFGKYDMLDKVIKDRDFDCFFHLANYGVNGADKENYKIQLNNTIIACDMVNVANNLGCRRYIFVGSVDEFEVSNKPDDSYILPTHSRIYGAAKYSAECIGKVVATNLGLEYVTALLSLTYGKGNTTNILPNVMIKNSFSGKPINLISGDNSYDIIYISEAVEAIYAIARNGKSMESYFVGHEELRTFKQIVEEINKNLENSIELKFGCYKDHGNTIHYEDINRQKLRLHTGYKCEVEIEEGITYTYKWMKEIYGIE